MINVHFYNFAKKENSTAQPSGTGTVLQCAVKTPSSVLSPVVEAAVNSFPAWNYCYIPDFGRYYFVTSTTYNRGLWEISLSVDVLASFKTQIGNTSLYVTRSSTRQNQALIDKMFPLTGNQTLDTETIDAGFQVTWSTGYVLVGIMDGLTTSGMTMYQFAPTEYGKFIAGLMGTDSDSSISTWLPAIQSIQVTTYEPLRYVGAAYWFPNNFNTGQAVTSLKLGNYTATGFTCAPVDTPQIPRTLGYTVTIPKHPQATNRGKWVNLEPYSQYEMSLGPFGTFKLDSTALLDATQIFISIIPDPMTGVAKAYIRTDEGTLLSNLTAQWGVPIRVSSAGDQTLGNVLQTVGGAVAVGVGAAAGNPIAVVGGLSASISGIADIAKGSFSTTGSSGALVEHQVSKILYGRFWTVAPEDNANKGRPFCSTALPSAIGGYIEAQTGLFSSDTATRTEINAVNAYMEGGFYYV